MLKGFSLNIGLRIGLLFLSLLILVWLMVNTGMWITMIFMALVIMTQVYLLVQYINHLNRDLTKFTESLMYEDYAAYFNPKNEDTSFQNLYQSFNNVIDNFQNKSTKQAVRMEYFRLVLSKVNMGIICLKAENLTNDDNKEIDFINDSAMDLLQIPPYKFWQRLEQSHPEFTTAVSNISANAKTIKEVNINGHRIPLIFEITPIHLQHLPYLIISFQNVKNEMEQKEVESWNKVFKVLAHEIMNSLTPINSLTNTIKMMIEEPDGQVVTLSNLEQNSIDNIHLAIQTIEKRSSGLLDFVDSYRMFTELPKPKLQPYSMHQIIQDVTTLLKPRLDKHNIKVDYQNAFQHILLPLDSNLIEQVLINMILNSVYALQNEAQPVIRFETKMTETEFLLTITDNGKGIAKEDLDNIWLPFYTTREGGSGIGLSLVRNIILAHGGQIWVQSELEQYTSFYIRFDV